MTNAWHCDDFCDISITDGTGWSDDYCRQSAAWGDPHPKPIGGKSIVVWSSGQWLPVFEDVLRGRVLSILNDAIATIAINKAEKPTP
jgi:hypothetical protein